MSHTPPVLVVDDEPAIRKMLTEVLSLEGYLTETAVNGRDALDLLAHSGPRVILLDLLMPVMDGRGMMVALRDNPAERHRHKVILCSAFSNLTHADDLEPDGILSKPFTIPQLLSVLESCAATCSVTSAAALSNGGGQSNILVPPAHRDEWFIETYSRNGFGGVTNDGRPPDIISASQAFDFAPTSSPDDGHPVPTIVARDKRAVSMRLTTPISIRLRALDKLQKMLPSVSRARTSTMNGRWLPRRRRRAWTTFVLTQLPTLDARIISHCPRKRSRRRRARQKGRA